MPRQKNEQHRIKYLNIVAFSIAMLLIVVTMGCKQDMNNVKYKLINLNHDR